MGKASTVRRRHCVEGPEDASWAKVVDFTSKNDDIIYIHTYIYMYVCIYIYIYTYIYCVYTYIWSAPFPVARFNSICEMRAPHKWIWPFKSRPHPQAGREKTKEKRGGEAWGCGQRSLKQSLLNTQLNQWNDPRLFPWPDSILYVKCARHTNEYGPLNRGHIQIYAAFTKNCAKEDSGLPIKEFMNWFSYFRSYGVPYGGG